MSLSRRSFLKSAGFAGVLGVSQAMFPSWMPKLVFSPDGQQSGSRDVLVAIFQRGGMDGLNAVVPFGEGALYYDRRPTIAIPEPGSAEGSAIDLNGFFGLHPALAPLKDIYDGGALTVVHAAGSPHDTRSHFDAMEYMERGIPGDKTTATGWISRHLQAAAWQNGSPFRAVGIGAMLPSSLRGPVNAMTLRSIADFHLGGREDQLAQIRDVIARMYSIEAPTNLLQAQAGKVFNTVDTLQRIASYDYAPANGAQYPDSEFGQGLQQVARLIKADVGLEIACLDIGGWDTHEEQGAVDGWMAGLLDDLGRGLAAFYADLRDDMDRVTVISMSEFGRRVTENASRGTDHGHGNAMFIMGGGATGQVYADWPGLADEALNDGDLDVTTDYRDVLAEVLLKRVGSGALDQIFPNHTVNIRGIIRDRV
jgi:uncharacterized protein (DUF1501 family)